MGEERPKATVARLRRSDKSADCAVAAWTIRLVLSIAVVGLLVYFGYRRSRSEVGRTLVDVQNDDPQIHGVKV